MAQEVKLMGATYSDVPSILLPDSNGDYHGFYDITDAETALGSDGTETLEDSITALTTYSNEITSAGDTTLSDAVYTLAQGYGSGGSGSSSWTLVASTSYTVSTTSTSAATVATWATGDSSIWTSDQIVYVRIRDTAGPRAGYFYGSDNFFINYNPANGSTSSTYSYGARYIYRYTSDSVYAGTAYNNTNGYGVYINLIYSDGRIRISRRYNATSSLTIDGTYSVECYLLTPPATLFE